MPSKRKREAKEHGLPTQANSSGSKKQKKSHAENPAIHEPREIRNEAPSVDIMEKKLETKDGAIKLAQRLAKKERRRLERTAKGGSHEGFKVPEAERSEKDGNRKSEEQEVPMEEETLVSNRLRDTLKEAPTVHGAVKKPESQNEAVVLEQKLAKKERRRSERARRGSKTQMTEEKPADGRQQSVEQEVSGNQTRLERTITSDDSLGAPKKAITVTRSVLSLQSGYEAPEIARKLTKREKRKLKRAEKESKTQKTDKKEGDETRKPEKRDIPKKLKRLEERQLKKGQGPSEKPAKTLPIGELPALDETEKIGKKLSLKSAEKGPREKQKRNGERKPEKTQGILRKPIKDPVWQISDPIGGHMLDIDPVFSLDEK